MKDKVEKILNSREWTFADLTNMSQLVKDFSEEINIPLVNLALCWCLKNKNVSTVILGASKKGQLKQNIETLNHMDKVDSSVMGKIEKIIS